MREARMGNQRERGILGGERLIELVSVHQREIYGDKEGKREEGRVRERYGKTEGVRDRERGLKRATKWHKWVV